MDRSTRFLPDLLYLIIWVLVIVLFVLDHFSGNNTMTVPFEMVLFRTLTTFGPLLLLFALNNYLLIPRLLIKGHMRSYLLWATVLLVAVLVLQYVDFIHLRRAVPHHVFSGPHPPRGLIPMPLLSRLFIDIMVVGANIAIALTLRYAHDRIDRERLMKVNAENKLSALRTQLSPHFYLNMLNNIHGMIEIDPAGAQEMVLEMSKLMRYMLYDSTHASAAPLSAEVGFIRSYLGIMRRRYPESKVDIEARLPETAETAGATVPPMLLPVFIENAFKHGISYRRKSYIRIDLRIDGPMILFTITNSIPPDVRPARSRGIGLDNARHRLELIYGPKARLDITCTPDIYNVELSLPAHEPENPRD